MRKTVYFCLQEPNCYFDILFEKKHLMFAKMETLRASTVLENSKIKYP